MEWKWWCPWLVLSQVLIQVSTVGAWHCFWSGRGFSGLGLGTGPVGYLSCLVASDFHCHHIHVSLSPLLPTLQCSLGKEKVLFNIHSLNHFSMIQLKILIELTRGGLYISCSDCTLVRAVCSHQGTATRQTVRPKPSTTSSLKAPSSSQTASQQQQLGETTPMQTTSSPPPKPAYRLAQFLFRQGPTVF